MSVNARRLDPVREMQAFEIVKATLATLQLTEPDILLDAAESETNLLETIDALAEADLFDDGLLEGVDGALRTLADRKARIQARIKARRAVIEQALLLMDAKKLERPTATLTIAERAPKLEITDESAIPARFFVSEPKLDKKALAAALKAGEAAPGAHLSNAVPTLTIRRR